MEINLPGRHLLLDDRIAITARINGVEFCDMSVAVLRDAYVEEITTYYTDYAFPEDETTAFLNIRAIAIELRRRDKDRAHCFIEETHALMLDVCPELDLSQLTCH